MGFTFYNPMHKIRKFHDAFRVKPFWVGSARERENTRLLRARLILEEAFEVIEALGVVVNYGEENGDVYADDFLLDLADGWEGGREAFEHLAKELADLKVVTYGTDDVFEIPAEKAFNEVMRSNMSKLGEDGKPIYREDGKVLKGPHYKEADMRGVLFGEWI